MDKEKYLEDRKALSLEAKTLLDEGKVDEANEKMAEIEAFDNKWEEMKLANANMKALEDNNKIVDLENKSEKLEGGKVMENIKIRDMEVGEVVATEEYRNAFLRKLQGKELTQQENALTGGSEALPTSTANMIVDKLVDMVPLLNEIELFRVDGNVDFMVNTVAPGATLEAGGGAVTESSATLVKVSLGGYNMNAFLSIGADLASMAVSAFEDWLVRKLAEAIAYKIEHYIINGDGDSEPKGIEKYATWDVGDGTAIDWTGGESGASLAVADLDNAIGLLPAAYDKESKFLMSKKTFYTNVINLTDVNNLPVVQREGTKFIVRGFEVVFSDQVAANDIFFGSFKRGMAGNLGVDIKVEKQRNLRYNSYDFLGWGVFDCKPAQTGCIVKIASDIPA